jgi:hypothetical protein
MNNEFAINFVQPKVAEKTEVTRVRSLTIAVTTVVLVIYVVAICGVVGWWAFWSSKGNSASTKVTNLENQVKEYADSENLIRRLDSKSRDVNAFILGRESVVSLSSPFISDLAKVTGWTYQIGSYQVVKVEASSTDKINQYSQWLTAYYSQVKLDRVWWQPSSGWVAEIALGGYKK